MQVRKKNLLIADNPDIPLFTALQEDGYEFITCDSPNKAWDLVLLHRPHCIIVDLHHPSRGVSAILQECRALAEGVPVIVAMSIRGNEAVMQALEEGVTSFLHLSARPGIIKKILAGLKPSIN